MLESFTERKKLGEIADWFENQFPEILSERLISLDKEYPVITKNFEAADARLFFDPLREMGWRPFYDEVYIDEVQGVTKGGVKITTDASWCTMEISVPLATSVEEAARMLSSTENVVANISDDLGYRVLGYGIQPLSEPREGLWVRRGVNAIARNTLPHEFVNNTVTAADQIHISITRKEIVGSVNIFNALSGPIIALFAHSPFWKKGVDSEGRHAVREGLWNFAEPFRSGMPPRPFASVLDYITFAAAYPILIASQANTIVSPKSTFIAWAMMHPQWGIEWERHEKSIWINSRPRMSSQTVEVRPACSQLPGENTHLAALILGIITNIPAFLAFIESRPWSWWIEQREKAVRGNIDTGLRAALKTMLTLAREGLQKRGRSEEHYLDVLFDRVEAGNSPAKDILTVVARGGLSELVKRTALQVPGR